MYNWSVDEKKFKRENPREYKIWRMEQLINYGLDGEKLEPREIKKNWSQLADKLDPYKKRLIEFLLWGKLYSLPDNLTFWNWSARTKK